MTKKILLAALVLVLIVGGWLVKMMWSAGQFKTIESHFAGKCSQISGVVGPEDITVHAATGIAYISASDRRAVIRGQPANGAIYAYDLTVKTPELVNLTPDAGADFAPHGISLHSAENGRQTLFVVNHASAKHRIEVYDLQAGRLSHRNTISDPALVSPNDIVGVGPDQFYVSNDHRYASGLMKAVEEFLQLRLSNVLYYDGSKFAEAAAGIGYANGINISADGRTLYLCAVTELAVHVYQRDIASGKLTHEKKIDLGTGVDNIERDPAGGLWIGAHPQLLRFLQHAQDPNKISPSQVLHLIPKADGDYDIREVYLNGGEEISASSVATIYGRRMLVGAVFDPKFLDCQISNGQTF